MLVTVVGIGYVGLSTAAFWAEYARVKVLDIAQEKVTAVNAGRCPFNDPSLHNRLSDLRERGRGIVAEKNKAGSYADARMIIVAVPTNFDPKTDCFDTSTVEGVIADALSENPNAAIVLRSTVHAGFCAKLQKEYGITEFVYFPEFSREGSSMVDCLHPDRVVVGSDDSKTARKFCDLLKDAFAANREALPKIVVCRTGEAEAAKLFANTYLAMRVAFFNEVDSYALSKELDASKIIDAICLDKRIGNCYNNPSFGYGGYCLPKDAKALVGCFDEEVPNILVSAVDCSNQARKDYLVNVIATANPICVGVYRLAMKSHSDNSRNSSVFDIIDGLVARGFDMIIFEPTMHGSLYNCVPITGDLSLLLTQCDIIIANRASEELCGYGGVIFTRDLFHRD